MRYFGRAFAMLLFVLILIITPVAFWVFNVQRVALDPQTYKKALRSQNVYQDLLPALVDGVASDSSIDAPRRQALRALINNMSADDWAALSDKILPPSWLQDQIEGNINRFFSWIDGARPTPGVSFDLSDLKAKLTGGTAQEAAQIVVPKLATCNAQQNALIDQAIASNNLDQFPLCNPKAQDKRQLMVSSVSGILNTIGEKLPARWDLTEQIRKSASRVQRDTDLELSQFRASIWLVSRLTVLLFLVPLGLLSLIVILTIRSAKQFFRWAGWALVGSGLLTLLPVPIMPGLMLGAFAGSRGNIQQGFGESGQLLASLLSGMLASIASNLTLAVLIQVAVAIGLGFVAIVLSIVLHAPDTADQQASQTQEMLQANAPAQPPGPALGATGSTPRPVATPPPTPADALTDLLDK